MRVLGEAEGVARASQCSLQVAQDSVYGLELGQFDAGRAAAGHSGLMDTGILQSCEVPRQDTARSAAPSRTGTGANVFRWGPPPGPRQPLA